MQRVATKVSFMTELPWLKSYPTNIKWDAKIEAKPLYSLLDEVVHNFPDNPAIDFMGRKFTYSELGKLVNKAAEGFKRLGVKKGTKVGIFLPNSPQFIISYYAILKAGGTVVNFSPLYSIPELKHQIEDSDVAMIVTFNLKILYPKVKELLGTKNFRKIIVGKMHHTLPPLKKILFPIVKMKELVNIEYDESNICWGELLEFNEISEIPETDVENDIAVLQYTGGTTGVPKGAMLTHKNVYVNAIQSGMWFSDVEIAKEKMLGVLPFFHVFAMTTVMNFSISKAAEIIIHPRFVVKNVIEDIARKRPTLMPGVPSMYAAINNFPDLNKFDLSSLKGCISGGAGLPIEVKEKFEKLTGCTLIEGYGLTETSPVVCANPFVGKNKKGSIGMPMPDTIVLIEDVENRGNFLGSNQRGELCVIGPQVMKGYMHRPDETEKVLRDGILRTGDVAMLDDEGYVFIVDRIKELILVGGFNVYPRNVEEVIYKHDAVLEAAVIGVHDEIQGQAVKACVALKPGKKLSEKELRDFIEPQLGKHEKPKYIEFRDSLPKTMIGKISKKDLK